jgi:hypothetical protein
MLLAPGRFFKPESGTETLLMQTIGIRDVVLGSGACAAWVRSGGGEFRGWATVGLISDSADLLLGLRSKPLVGAKSALIAALAPVPFVGAGRASPDLAAGATKGLDRIGHGVLRGPIGDAEFALAR